MGKESNGPRGAIVHTLQINCLCRVVREEGNGVSRRKGDLVKGKVEDMKALFEVEAFVHLAIRPVGTGNAEGIDMGHDL